jgi:hypothetical protein
MSYLLSCDCGKHVSVTEGSAGAALKCECGRTISVPSLRQLRQLPREDELPSASSKVGFAPSESVESRATTQTANQVVDALYAFVATQMQNGVSGAEIQRQLIGKGLDAASANSIVCTLQEARKRLMRAAGRKNMIVGGLVCLVGLAVTVFTMQAAANAGGGRYVVAWGAVVFGAIQFFRGLTQTGKE